ncbi:glycosyltransferase family 2 protein [Streptococcus suis]|nr:glycosyltransferase family 2 protein [Streptococcus suis]
MKSSSVSMIIPTYGGSNSLKRAIESVIDQNYGNFNIIVVDDNDPASIGREKTISIMESYLDNEKIVYLQHEKNKNGSAARNTGARASEADYFCFIDDDDVSFLGRISEQVAFLDSHLEYDACYCWSIYSGKKMTNSSTGDLTKSLLDLSFSPPTSTIMIRRSAFEFIGGFDETYRRHQDYEFLLRFYKHFKIGVVENVLVEKLTNEINNQLSGQKLYELKKYFFENFSNEIENIERKEPGFKKVVYAAHFSYTCKELLRRGQVFLAAKTYFNYGYKGGTDFWRCLTTLIFNGLKKSLLRYYYETVKSKK